MLYLDLTETYNNKELQNAKEAYSIGEKTISNIPCILVFKDAKLEDIFNVPNIVLFFESAMIKGNKNEYFCKLWRLFRARIPVV